MSQSVTSLETKKSQGFRKPIAVPLPIISPIPELAPSVFDYQDYRAYLKDFLALRQKTHKAFTLAKFAKLLGFSSHSGLAMVLSGQRELRPPYIDRCVKHLKLSLRQQLYFEAMIRTDRMTAAKRRALLQEIDAQASHWEAPEVRDGIRLLDFFIVQQILSLYRGSVPLAAIRAHFRYPIDKASLELVLNYMVEKFIAESSPAGYRINRSILVIADEIPNASGKQFHKDALKLAASALESDPLDRREFQTYALTVDSSRILEMKTHIKKLVMEALSEYETELDGDTVVQLHFHLFELTQRLGQTPSTQKEGNA